MSIPLVGVGRDFCRRLGVVLRCKDAWQGGAPTLKTITKRNTRSLLLLIVLLPTLFNGSLLLASPTVGGAWPQDAGNAQRTGYTAEVPNTPWRFLWSWNGPDANGGTGNHFYDAPREARTVAADNKLFAPAGSSGLYALNLTNGAQLWHVDAAAFMAAPAYAGGMVYAGGADGTLYKIDAADGRIVDRYTAGSPISKAILIVGSAVYAVSDDGRLHKVNSGDMSAAWVYAAGSTIATPPSYSATRDVILYATDDLYVHAVNNGDGSRKWRVKPTPASPGGKSQQTVAGTYLGAQFDLAWPVVADASGVVLLRMQLPHQALFEGPNEGLWSRSNAENRAWLQANPQWQNLFALSLDSGAKAFVPIVGYGSTEDYVDGGSQGAGTQGVMGSQPVVRTLPDGNEVAYIHFRNGQHDSDFRWSGHMGEMVLDDATVAGLAAGDLRFVDTHQTDQIIDEQNPLTVAGDTLLYSHWAAVVTHVITNRSDGLGLSAASPIATTRLPSIVRAVRACGAAADAATHWTTGACGGLSYVTDGGRHFDGPGWWGYWDVADPPGWRVGSGNAAGTSYSAGFLPRYAYVAEGKVVVSGNGGELLVFSHSSSGAPPTSTPTPTPTATPTPIPGATYTPTSTPTRSQNPNPPDPPTPIPTPTLPPVPCSPGNSAPGVEARCFQFFLPYLQAQPR